MFISSILISSLVCAVSYTTQYGEKLYFRKFFKFQVSYIWAHHYTGGVNSRVSLEEAWEMSQVYNRANAITILAMVLVSCGLQPSVCEVIVTFLTFSGRPELFFRFPFLPVFSWMFPVRLDGYFFLPNGCTLWENRSVQFAIYFQSGFEAAGCEDEVLQCGGKCATLKYQRQHKLSEVSKSSGTFNNQVILQIEELYGMTCKFLL